MIQFSLDELKEIEAVVSGDLKLKLQKEIKREENGVVTDLGEFIPFSKTQFLEVRRYEEEVIDSDIIHCVMPSLYEENYKEIYSDLERAIEKSKRKINGDVTVTACYNTETSLGFDVKLIKALRINGVDTPINY